MFATVRSEAQTPVLPPGTTYKAGFPLVIPGAGSIRAGHPAVADLGLTPGHKSIVFGTSGHKLYVVLYDGRVAPGFPVTLPSEITSSAAIGDADGDGKPDIVVGYGSTFEGVGVPGGVRAYRNTGALLWAKTTADFDNNGVPDAVINSPAIADVDGDGKAEVAFGSADGYVYLVKGIDGTDKPGWPVFVRDNVASAPALHDIDGDGKLDIIIGIDGHDGPENIIGGYLEVFRFDGTRVAGFPKWIDQVVFSAPAVGDIDGDGRPEIVVGTGTFYPWRTHAVYALRCDGSLQPGWPVAVEGQVSTGPALADLDGDGIAEVIVTDDRTGTDDKPHVYGFKGNGTRLFRTIPKAFAGVSFNAADPIVGDILGDGQVEILVPTNTEACVLDRNGRQLTDDGSHLPGSFSFWTENALASAVLADFEPGTPGIELVAVSSVPDASPTSSAKVHVWVRPQSGPQPWGAYRQNAARTAVLPGTPSCPASAGGLGFYTVAPCRIFDTRDPVGPYGGPALGGAAQRSWVIAGRCEIPTDARAISGNLTVVAPTTSGSLRIFATTEGPVPVASATAYQTGQVRADNVLVQLSASGSLTVLSDQPFGTAHVLLDVNGYFK